MITSTKKRLAFGLAVTAMVAAASISSPAKADPQQFSAVVGVGSDTTQNVMNAMAGFLQGTNFTPVQSSTATGSRQLISWDAVGSTCISPKINFGTFTRPNGSTQGRRALSRAIDGTKYGTAACGGPIDVSGEVDFARSSAGPAAGDLGTDLTYIPMGRDALSFAYYQKNPTAGAPTVTTLTRAQLTSLFTTGPQTIGTTRIVPCGIQLGSGTYAFWQTVTTATAAQEDAATTLCNSLIVNTLAGRSEENDGNALKARGDAIAAVAGETNTEVVIGYSAANYIAQSNLNVTPGAPPAGVLMGNVSNNGAGVALGVPVQGTAPTMTPAASFYGDATFGRNVYTVWPTSVVTSLIGNADIKGLVVGPTSAMCAAASTVQEFGFLSLGANCGSTALKGSLIAGQL